MAIAYRHMAQLKLYGLVKALRIKLGLEFIHVCKAVSGNLIHLVHPHTVLPSNGSSLLIFLHCPDILHKLGYVSGLPAPLVYRYQLSPVEFHAPVLSRGKLGGPLTHMTVV